MVGFQLYLPPAGKIVLAGNFTRSESSNIAQTIAEGGDRRETFRIAHYYDINLFVDFTGAVRGALSFQRTTQTYGTNDWAEGAGPNEKNDRSRSVASSSFDRPFARAVRLRFQAP